MFCDIVHCYLLYSLSVDLQVMYHFDISVLIKHLFCHAVNISNAVYLVYFLADKMKRLPIKWNHDT